MPSSEFESARRVWEQVTARASASFLLNFDYVFPLLKAFGSSKETVAFYEGRNGPEAAAILAQVKPMTWSTFQPTEACLGLWVQPRNTDAARLVSQLLAKLPGFPVVLALTHQDPRLSPRPADSGCVRTLDYIQTACVHLKGSFDEYWAARGKNLRTNMRKARTQLERNGTHARLIIVTHANDVPSAIADYACLEATGWKGQAGTAIDSRNAQGRFYTEMLQRACERGLGKIYRYLFNDRVVAMDLCVEDGESLVILKTAYAEECASFSPASLMREEQCRQQFDAGRLRRIEFYGPLMEWHTRWTNDVRTMYHVNYYRNRFLPAAHEALKRRAPTAHKAPSN